MKPTVATIIKNGMIRLTAENATLPAKLETKKPSTTLQMDVKIIIAMDGSVNFIVANTFGAGDKEKANRYFSLFVYMAFVLGVLFAILGSEMFIFM